MPSLRQRLALAIAPKEVRALTANDAIRGLWAGVQTSTGLRVDEKSSLQVIAVFNAIKILSEGFAQVPLKVYRREGVGRDEARQHKMYKLLHDAPNERMTAFNMRQHWMGSLGLWGNSYTECVFNNRGEIDSLWPLNPGHTKKERLPDGRVIYRVTVNSSNGAYAPSQDEVVLSEHQVLHIMGFSLDGFIGLSPIQMIRENIGLADAYTQFAGKFFANDAMDFALFTERVMQQPQLEEMHKEWSEKHGGLNKHRLAIFHGGLKPEKIGMPLDDAQFIEQRQFSREEIFSFYRIPPNFYAADKVSSWGTGIEQMSVGFIKFTLDPWFVLTEQSLNLKFLSENAQGPLFSEFDREGFLRGDFNTRINGYKTGRDGGWYSANDIRRLENLPAIGPEGDIYLIPSNMTPADKIEAIADKAAAPDPAPVVAPAEPQGDNAATRVALIASQRPAFIDAVDRVLRRAAFDTAKEREKRKDDADYEKWLADFAVDHRVFCAKHLAKPLDALAEVIRVDVSRETGKDVPIFPNLILHELHQFAERVAGSEGPADSIVSEELIRMANDFAECAYRSVDVHTDEPVVIDGYPVLVQHRYSGNNQTGAQPISVVVNNSQPQTPVNVRVPAPIMTVQLPAQPPAEVTVNVPEQPAPIVNIAATELSPVFNVAAPEVSVNVPTAEPQIEVQTTTIDVTEEIRRRVQQIEEAEMKPDQMMEILRSALEQSDARWEQRMARLLGEIKPVQPPSIPVTINFPKDAIRVEVAPSVTNINKGAVEVNIPTTNYPATPGDTEIKPLPGGGFSVKRSGNVSN